MKLALHRSIVFWSGLLVMGFVCWAWADSRQMTSRLIAGPLAFINANSGIAFFSAGGKGPSSLFEVDRGPNEIFPDWNVLPKPHFLRQSDMSTLNEGWDPFMGRPTSARHHHFRIMAFMPSGSAVLFLPHWLILLTVAAVWLALLFLRAKRRSKTVITK